MRPARSNNASAARTATTDWCVPATSLRLPNVGALAWAWRGCWPAVQSRKRQHHCAAAQLLEPTQLNSAPVPDVTYGPLHLHSDRFRLLVLGQKEEQSSHVSPHLSLHASPPTAHCSQSGCTPQTAAHCRGSPACAAMGNVVLREASRKGSKAAAVEVGGRVLCAESGPVHPQKATCLVHRKGQLATSPGSTAHHAALHTCRCQQKHSPPPPPGWCR